MPEQLSDICLGKQRMISRATRICPGFRVVMKRVRELASSYPEHGRPIELLPLIYVQLADFETRRKNPEQAMQHASQSLAYLEQRVAGGADTGLGRELSVAYDRVGSSALELGNVDEALEYFKKAMEMDRRRAANTPDDVRAQMDLMASHYRIASVAEVLEDWTMALQAYDEGIAIAKRLIQAELYVEEAQAKLEALTEMRRQAEQRRRSAMEAADDSID